MSNQETIALFIDGDNISHRDMPVILNEIKGYGRIVIQHVYGDWSYENMKGWRDFAISNGIEPIQSCRIKGKNSTDIGLVVDVMEVLFTLPHITLFYIVTTDRDFVRVISKIKKQNKKVNCIGGDSANDALMSTCDVFTKIEVLRENQKELPREIITPISRTKNKRMLKNIYDEIDLVLAEKNEVDISILKTTLIRKYQFDNREFTYKVGKHNKVCQSMSEFVSNILQHKYEIIKEKDRILIKAKDV